MKLAELLAVRMPEWPNGVSAIFQSPETGNVLCNEFGVLFQLDEIAEDSMSFVFPSDWSEWRAKTLREAQC